MGNVASAETVLKNAVKRTYGTVRKRSQKAKTFKAWTVSQLLEQYRDPRAILLEIASMETAKLAAEMHGTLADALAERRLCAQAVLPYVCQKLPAQIDLRSSRTINLNIVDERQYQDLVEIAATDADTEGTFSMQLLTSTSDETASDSSADAPQQPLQQQDRALVWDIHPSNKGAQRKNVTSIDAVTPPASAPAEKQ